MPLTDVILRKVKPRDKTFKLADGGGMYLEVSPKGGTWWRLKYRFAGKEKRISLGVYPTVTLKEARGQREDARKLLAEGIDPGDNRKAQKAASTDRAANSFEVLAREWFGQNSPAWAPNHADRVLRLLGKPRPSHLPRPIHLAPLFRAVSLPHEWRLLWVTNWPSVQQWARQWPPSRVLGICIRAHRLPLPHMARA